MIPSGKGVIPVERTDGEREKRRYRPPLMDEGKCVFCGAKSVRFSRSRLRHLLRAVLGTHRRYCPACGHAWTSQTRASRLLPGLGLAIAAASLVLALTAAVVIGSSRIRAPRHEGAAGRAASRAGSAEAGSSVGFRAGSGGVRAPEREWSADLEDDAGSDVPARAHEPLADGQARHRSGPIMPDIPADMGRRPGLGEMLGDALRLLKMMAVPQRGSVESDLERLDKKQLWDKYGHYFGSKEDAKRAYEQYKGQKRSAK